MKRFILLSLIILLHSACGNTSGSSRTSITVSESENKFMISADYDPDKQNQVAAVLDEYLKVSGNPSFENTELDADMVLSDRVNFHIKFSPGNLDIELPIPKNTEATHVKFKKMAKALGEAIK